MKIRDRIKSFRRVPANQLRPSPRNWRTHPADQHDALRGVLAEIGIAGPVLVRVCEDKSLELIDGHLRVEEMGDEKIPVAVTDLTAEEAAKLTAVYDPIGDMAEPDQEKLDALLTEVQTESPALRKLLDALQAEAAEDPSGDATESDDEDLDTAPQLDTGMTYRIIIECTDEAQQKRLLETFEREGIVARGQIN